MELRQYIAIIRHWVWLIVLGVLLAGGVAYVVSVNSAPVYQTSIRLLISQAPGESSGTEYSQIMANERLAQTYIELIKTRPILQETVDILGLPLTVRELANNIRVSQLANTQIIVITVEDNDPHRVALITNTLAEVFIEQNKEIQAARYGEAIVSWERAVEQAANLVEDLEAQVAAVNPGDPAVLARLEPQLTQARASYNQTFNQLQSLRVAQAREASNVTTVEPAVVPAAPIRPRVVNNTLLAAVVGGMLALGIVFLIEYLDDTVKTPEQVDQLTGLPSLGAISSIEGQDNGNPPQKLIARLQPRAPASEAYRMVRTNLSFSAIDGGLAGLTITSASPGEGKSTTAANLAIVMAQAGQNIILVDADLRRPMQHKLFAASNSQGLTTALLDSQSPATHYLQETGVAGLRLLTSGPLPPNPSELLNSQRMKEVIENLKKEAATVIFDSPPLLSVADAAILGGRLNGVLLVLETGGTRQGALVQAVETLLKTNAAILGVVMNRVPVGRGGYYHYYYQQYSDYSYASEQPALPFFRRLPAWLWGRSKG